MSSVLVIIPARAGSKGLRGKNLRTVGGVPMLSRAIATAHQSRFRGEEWHIIVSTDSPRYARLARAWGAWVPSLRPKHLATDKARLIDVVLYTLEVAEAVHGAPDTVILLSATAPLILPKDVRRALTLHRVYKGSPVAAVVRDPVHASWRFALQDGCLHRQGGERVQRRQEGEPTYRLAGAIYVATPLSLRRHGQFVVSKQTHALVLPKQRAVDVDDALDLGWARFLAKKTPPQNP